MREEGLKKYQATERFQMWWNRLPLLVDGQLQASSKRDF